MHKDELLMGNLYGSWPIWFSKMNCLWQIVWKLTCMDKDQFTYGQVVWIEADLHVKSNCLWASCMAIEWQMYTQGIVMRFGWTVKAIICRKLITANWVCVFA
jgi:hypothetical protein